MAEEFNPIQTQEELDKIINARLEENTKTVTAEVEKRFAGFVSAEELKKQTDKLNADIVELTAKNRAYEITSAKEKIAREFGIPYELSGRLSGETEKDIRADAESFSKLLASKQPAPLASTEPAASNSIDNAFRSMLSGMNDI